MEGHKFEVSKDSYGLPRGIMLDGWTVLHLSSSARNAVMADDVVDLLNGVDDKQKERLYERVREIG